MRIIPPDHVGRPYPYNFCKMKNINIGKRKRPFAEMLREHMTKYGLSVLDLAKIANEYSSVFGTRVTCSDLNHYLTKNVSPKIDKLYALSMVMGVPLEQLCGYSEWPKSGK